MNTSRLSEPALRRLGTRLWRHADVIEDVAYSPSGRQIATASWDETVCVGDAESGRRIHEFDLRAPGEYTENYGVAFSPDEKLLAHGGMDRVVYLRELSSGQFAELSGHVGSIMRVGFSPKGRLLASASDDYTVRLWDIGKRAELYKLLAERAVNDVRFSHDGNMLGFCDRIGHVHVFDIARGVLTKSVYVTDEAAKSLTFIPGTNQMVIGSENGQVSFLTPESFQLERTLTFDEGNLRDLQISPDGRLLAVARDHEVHILDVESGKATRQIHLPDWVTRTSFSPVGSQLAIGSHDCKLRIGDVASGEEANQDDAPLDRLVSVSSSPDGETILSTAMEPVTRVWSVASGEQLAARRWNANLASEADFLPARHLVAVSCSTGGTGTVNLWKFDTNEIIGSLANGEETVWSLRFSADGKLMATADESGQTLLWETEGFTQVMRIGVEGKSPSIDFSPDSAQLAIAAGPTVEIWDLASRRMTMCLESTQGRDVSQIAWSPTGSLLACLRTHFSTEVWNLKTKKVRKRVKGGERVLCAAFSHDGLLLASGGGDSDIRVWNTKSWRGMVLAGHDAEVNTLDFSACGRFLVSGSHDTTIIVWDANAIAKQLAR